ncbi:NfeD family protein [Tropicimonas isoalkanivorans]|uniref:NfeD-like C-terminal, partner-binding n=1 Tax=Tropicimonas isoalkanivorans TaxID=441112 RepID=A0A1I1KT57_9RHOB|nr:hypothetical protein [Tropicimonas isoalkanivorans]SFC63442.1 hypothetical protein SAMN04488094_10756 [Tropicimonas isoalkanivorans]
MWWSEWWVWMVAGLLLAILEVLAPGWIFLGFAIGAGVTSLFLLVGGPLAAWLASSLPALLVFSAVLSLLAWLALRRLLGSRAGSVKTYDEDING